VTARSKIFSLVTARFKLTAKLPAHGEPMTDTETHPQQQTNPAAEPGPYYVQPRNEWPINAPYQHEAPYWPPAQPPNPPDDTPDATGAAPQRGRRRMVVAALVAALVLGGGAAGGAIAGQFDHGSAGTASTSGGTATAARVVSSGNLADVVDAVSPSIVDVKVATGQGTAEGSGIVLTSNGRVVTNNHVVESSAGSGAVTITLADGRTAQATVVGTNAQADLAVLQMEGVSGLTPATLGDSSALSVGDTVLAFGSPLGLQGTVTSGIVSALDRSLSSSGESLSGLLQTDAAINEGNSGGALVDTAGRVVGINVAIATTGQDTGNIGVGFAIPVNTVKTVVDQIVN
jgi:putative serine protease PepD